MFCKPQVRYVRTYLRFAEETSFCGFWTSTRRLQTKGLKCSYSNLYYRYINSCKRNDIWDFFDTQFLWDSFLTLSLITLWLSFSLQCCVTHTIKICGERTGTPKKFAYLRKIKKKIVHFAISGMANLRNLHICKCGMNSRTSGLPIADAQAQLVRARWSVQKCKPTSNHVVRQAAILTVAGEVSQPVLPLVPTARVKFLKESWHL